MRNRLPPPYVPLVALYPLFALAAENAEEIISLRESAWPIAITLASAGAAWIGSGIVVCGRTRQGLLALLIVVFISWYGVFTSILVAIPVEGRSLDGVAFPLWILGFAMAVAAVARWTKAPTGLERYLNIATTILVIFPLITLARHHRLNDPVDPSRPSAVSHIGPAEGPDIFLIVLDKYTAAGPLRKNYGYDNSPFLDSLRARGFFVPERAHANYVHTTQALASLLNWTYLDDVAREVGSDTRDRSALYRMIRDNRAWSYLSRQGYEFVFLPTPYRGTTRNPHARLQLPEPFSPSINFGVAWMLNTVLAPAVGWACETFGCEHGGAGRFPYPPETPTELEWKFKQLEKLAARPGRQFVFAHLLLPHEPFVFRADCTHREPYWEPDDEVGSGERKAAYVGQITCVNRMLLRLVDRLQSDSEDPPVIVLQADHGHGRFVLDPMRNRVIPRSRLHPSQVEERISVFAAYAFPGMTNELFYDSITPINVFPLILRHYFHEPIDLREDATYWNEPGTPYRFTRVR